MRKNLTTIALIAGALLAVLFFVLRIHQANKEEVLAQFNENQLQITQQAARQIESDLRSYSQDLRWLSYIVSLRAFDRDKITGDLRSNLNRFTATHIQEVFLLNEKGFVVYSTTPDVRGANHFQSDFFTWARDPRNKGTVRMWWEKAKGRRIPATAGSFAFPHIDISLVTPLYRESVNGDSQKPVGKFAGALIFTVDLEEILTTRSLLYMPGIKLPKFWIVDRGGTLLVHSGHPEMVMRNIQKKDETCNRCHTSFDYIERILGKAKGIAEYQIKGERKMVAAFTSIPFENTSWIVVMNASLDDVTAFERENLKNTLLLLGAEVFLLCFAFFFTYRNYRLRVDSEMELKRLRENQTLLEELQETRDHLVQFLNSSPVMIYSCEAFGNFDRTFISQNIKALLGYEPAEFLTPGFWAKGIHPEDTARVLAYLSKYSDKGDYVIEYRFLHKEGAWRWVHDAFNLIRDQTGNPQKIVGYWRDITQRKQMDEEIKNGIERLRNTLGVTVYALSSVAESRDPYTAGHQQRVADLACAIATEMGLAPDQIEGLRMAGTIHDIGKISVPAEILSMPRKLKGIEFSLIKTHVQNGYEILKDIEFPWPVARIVLEHHEKIDGSGYPNGLIGDKLLIESRIIAVADVVEAMASHRPYRPGLGIDVTLDEISKNKGIIYDAEVVDACLRLFREGRYAFVS